MFRPVSAALCGLAVAAPPEYLAGQPRRKCLERPIDKGTFILPLKQSFIKDARIMPGTARLLALVAGWVGNDKSWTIETTQGILGRHLKRSTRQIYRYLKDAMEEGYLLCSYTKNRMGLITGLRIWLNLAMIRRQTRARKRESRRNQDQTFVSDTNGKSVKMIDVDPEFRSFIEKICKRNGIDPPPLPT